MNREIKFRGKPANKVDGVFKSDWYYGFLTPASTILGESYAICESKISEWWEFEANEVIAETVGQFTGLYDKKGTPIYEGDIVDAWSGRHHITRGIIRYEPPRFLIGLYDKKGKEFNGSWYLSPNAFGKDELLEVIGNIHDNPELLNGTS